ncbi:hypothetical protein Pfo_015275 [Paulownia fortunei]|nr:hypothetical protein Pfo_015275 [Paulownia fortunei]
MEGSITTLGVPTLSVEVSTDPIPAGPNNNPTNHVNPSKPSKEKCYSKSKGKGYKRKNGNKNKSSHSSHLSKKARVEKQPEVIDLDAAYQKFEEQIKLVVEQDQSSEPLAISYLVNSVEGFDPNTLDPTKDGNFEDPPKEEEDGAEEVKDLEFSFSSERKLKHC